MSKQYRRFDDDDSAVERGGGLGVGTIVLATALGVGIGLLAAPETGTVTRRRLRRRMAELGTDLGEGLEGMHEFSGRAREQMRARLESLRAREAELADDDEDEDEESHALGTILALAAGAAATYFLSSERAAPARVRARDAADNLRRRAGDAAADVRRRASDRWERYQQQRGSNGMTASESQTETSGGSSPSGEVPRGS